MTDVADALEDDERVLERFPLRTGGTLALTDTSLLVDAAGSVTRIDREDIVEITVEQFDWFVGLLSLVLFGWGLISTRRDVAVGLIFASIGGASVYWTYRKRGKVRIKVEGRPRPMSVFPEDTGQFTDAMEAALDDD
ncbi:hypothetical protein [Halorussus amylolyticus]|uniref:hypothetical protein n=1 Tax=Halorussus amylolyticus TaxID=1126242 RepID=UPI0010507CCC|nr:hypothetical protein [Halorussus amylolyticus]